MEYLTLKDYLKLGVILSIIDMPNPKIKDEDKYLALREKGYGKEKSVRIANTPDSGKKGGKAKPYEKWTKQELYAQAKNVGIEGRSKMNKEKLIHALRNN